MEITKPTTISFDALKPLLAERPRDAHKGLFGHVLVVGGLAGMAGAVRLAAEAALRVGAGLVSVATLPENVNVILAGRPEIMAHGLKRAGDLKPLLMKSTVIVVGPGLGQTYFARRVLKQVLASSLPKVIDADALNLLAKHPQQSTYWVLTPHPGEAARLLNCTVDVIQGDRTQAAQKIQQNYQGVIVLKGKESLVCTADSLSVCPLGNPGMASAGMGDVLSGVIGGLLAQKITLSKATELAVYLHAHAGDLAAKALGERGLLASDLMPYLHLLVNEP